MYKVLGTIILFSIALNSFTNSSDKSFSEGHITIDSLNVNKAKMLEQHFETNVVLMPNGIYEGYLPYVHELVPSDFNESETERRYNSTKIPDGYMYFINIESWTNYLEKHESSFYENLKKYESISDSSKELYSRKYLSELKDLQIRDRELGVYSFERAVVVSYLKALGSHYVYYISYNHYMKGGKHDAGIDENPTFRVALGEEIDIWIELKDWLLFLKKYNLLEDIKTAWNLNSIEAKVDYNEKVSGELNKLKHFQELITWREGVDSGEIFLNIEQFEAYLKDMQKKYPGSFQNNQRIQNQRKIELEKLEYYKNFEYEHCIALEQNLFPDDLSLRILRLKILQYFVSAKSIRPAELWYINYPDFTFPKEIAYKVEYNYGRPKAVYFGERDSKLK